MWVWVWSLTWRRDPGPGRHEEAGAGHESHVPEAVGVLVGRLVPHQAVVHSDAGEGQREARQQAAQVAPLGREQPPSEVHLSDLQQHVESNRVYERERERERGGGRQRGRQTET